MTKKEAIDTLTSILAALRSKDLLTDNFDEALSMAVVALSPRKKKKKKP